MSDGGSSGWRGAGEILCLAACQLFRDGARGHSGSRRGNPLGELGKRYRIGGPSGFCTILTQWACNIQTDLMKTQLQLIEWSSSARAATRLKRKRGHWAETTTFGASL